ncbi:MAG: hypothetical protein Aureis2KO_17390 [Aureisphaera sp.]
MEYLNIKECIKNKGIGYKELGEIVGLTKTSIARIAAGKQTPNFVTLAKIANALDVEVKELFKSTEEHKRINGFIEFDGNIYPVKNITDLNKLIKLISDY